METLSFSKKLPCGHHVRSDCLRQLMHRASTSFRPTAEQAEAVAALEVASIAATNEGDRDVNLYNTFDFVSRISTVNLNVYTCLHLFGVVSLS